MFTCLNSFNLSFTIYLNDSVSFGLLGRANGLNIFGRCLCRITLVSLTNYIMDTIGGDQIVEAWKSWTATTFIVLFLMLLLIGNSYILDSLKKSVSIQDYIEFQREEVAKQKKKKFDKEFRSYSVTSAPNSEEPKAKSALDDDDNNYRFGNNDYKPRTRKNSIHIIFSGKKDTGSERHLRFNSD